MLGAATIYSSRRNSSCPAAGAQPGAWGSGVPPDTNIDPLPI